MSLFVQCLRHTFMLTFFCNHRTKLIEDSRRPDPQFRGLAHGTSYIVRTEGLAGIYRGLSAVVSDLFVLSESYPITPDSIVVTSFTDAPTRGELCCPVHHVLHLEAAYPRQRSSWTTLAWRSDVWDWRDRRDRHCL